MIIKKNKQQNIKNNQLQKQKEPEIQEVEKEQVEANTAEAQIVVPEEHEIEKADDKTDIFAGFNFDEIKYNQRAERRRGDRRRGYRRIDERNLISRAQQEAISIKEQAARDGYEKGIKEASDAIEEMQKSIAGFFEYKEELFEAISDNLLDISIKVAEKIIKKEVETDKKVLDAIIHDAMKSLAKDENKIILKVNPTDVEYTKEIVPKLLSSGQFEAKIYVSGDKEVDEGSTVIETSNGVIDATISTQLELIKEAFKQA